MFAARTRPEADSGAAALLLSRPVIDACARDEALHSLRQQYPIRQVRFPSSEASFRIVVNRVRLPGLTLHYVAYSAPIEIAFGAMAGPRQYFCLTGSGTIGVGHGEPAIIDRARSRVVAPGDEINVAYSEGYSQLVLEFDEHALLRKLEGLTGEHYATLPVERLRKLGATPTSWRLRNIAMSLAAQWSEDLDEHHPIVTELSQAVSTAFIFESLLEPLPQEDRRAPDVDHGVLARLEDYMRAHWDRALTAEDIAEACGVSVRSVFAAFKRNRGESPMAFMRAIRLDHARQLLEEGAAVSVIDVALRCGFSSFGHFARRYHDRFGELPSATARRRGAVLIRSE